MCKTKISNRGFDPRYHCPIARTVIIAQRIGISENLAWARNSTRGLFIGCIRTHAHGRQVTSECLVIVTSSCEFAPERIHGLLEAYFNIKVKGEQKNNLLFV